MSYRSRLALCLLLLLSCVARGQQAAPAPPFVDPRPDMLEHWRRATVSLGQVATINGVQQFVTWGSGVLVTDGKAHAGLLTAKHVVFNPDEGVRPTQISMRAPKTAPSSTEDLGVVIQLVINGRNTWVDSDEASDLVVLPLPDLSKYKSLHAVALSDFGTAADIYQGAPVIILGYPGILGESYQTAPIARNGIVAWVDPDDPLKKPFLVDANIFGGNSGGPVFRLRNGIDRHGDMVMGGGVAFIGIVSADAKEYSDVVVTDKQTYATHLYQPNPANGKPNDVEAVVKNIGGIGVIQPVTVARRLVEKAFELPMTPLK